MTTEIEIVVERDPSGRLHAFVRQGAEDGFTKRGADILAERAVRNVEEALRECNQHVQRLYKLVAVPKVRFVFPGSTA